VKGWHEYGPGSAKSVLFGIWDIDQLTIDGKPREPLITDNDRWKRAIFDYPESVAFQRMDDSLVRYDVALNVKDQTLALTKPDDKNWKANFTYKRGPEDHLQIDGGMDGRQTHMILKLKDPKKFMIVSRGFHWINEVPFNR
jgi:hypothetical protein